jgi:glycosyltransferase involved in cell wall biosynthesis
MPHCSSSVRGIRPYARDLAGPALDWIVFTGFVDDITLKKCYALCDLYVCPSRLEGFGLTILEAFAAGKPVVATRVGAISELVQDGQNGILVPSENVTAMADDYCVNFAGFWDRISRSEEDNVISLDDPFRWAKTAENTERSIFTAEVILKSTRPLKIFRSPLSLSLVKIHNS